MIHLDTVDPIIQAVNISKQVTMGANTLVILQNISLTVAKGNSLAIVGKSGAGKTTLLSLLAGLDVPTTGSVVVGGIDLYQLTEEQRAAIRGRYFGYIFQSFYLLANLTALENVILPLEIHGMPDADERGLELLAEVGLADRAKHYPGQLSGGEQQRVAIARAFAAQPTILFADEPTGNLDQTTGDTIIQKLFALNGNFGTTLIIITHDQSLAQQCATTLQLDRGSIV